MEYKIIKATLLDVPDIQKLNKKLFELELSLGFDSNLDINWSLSEGGKKEISERVISYKDSCGFIVKHGKSTVGYLIGRILEEETGREESRYADLEHMFIEESCRGKGVGKQLVDKFKQWIKTKGLKMVKVNVSFKNKKAIQFYSKIGLMPLDITLVGTVPDPAVVPRGCHKK